MVSDIQKQRARRFVVLTVFSYSVGFGIIMPALPQLIVELEQVTLSEAARIGAWIGAVYAICQFLMGPLVGNLGDRFGRRPVFLCSLGGYSIDFLLMGLAPSIFWLFVGRGIAGGLGAIFGPANAVMADISDDAERAKGFGMVGAAFGIGFIVGPAVGGLLGDFGPRVPFFVAAALAGATFCYGWFAFPETMPVESRRQFSWKRANPVGAFQSLKKLQGVVGVSMVYLVWVTSTNVYPISWSFFAPIQYGWDVKMVGLSLTFVGASMAVVQTFLLGRVVARMGERNTATFGLACAALGMLFYAFNQNATLALWLCLLVGIQGMIMPSLNAMMSRRTPSDAQGELQGFNGSLAALAALAAPLLYNVTLAHFTSNQSNYYFPGVPFLIASGLAVVALLLLLCTKPCEQSAGLLQTEAVKPPKQ